jgi:6-phosphofructokinase 2
MIVTITMNPALDKSTTVSKLAPEKKMRCAQMITEAGGGGINVSKAIKKLDGESIAIFPSGGMNGKKIEEYLAMQGINCQIIPTKEETRENIVVSETETNAQFRFVLPGAKIGAEEASACLQTLEQLKPAPTYIVASGSLPPGITGQFFSDLAKLAKKLKARFVIDTSGEPLQMAAKEGVFLLKPNLGELSALVGRENLELNEVDDAALEIVRKGSCEVMVVSLGPSGALLVTKDGCEHIPSPTVKKQSTVGAGDSMVAGMVWMLSQGKSLKEMARFGVACGTAATMNAGTQLFKKEDVNRLYDWINKHAETHKLNLDA